MKKSLLLVLFIITIAKVGYGETLTVARNRDSILAPDGKLYKLEKTFKIGPAKNFFSEHDFTKDNDQILNEILSLLQKEVRLEEVEIGETNLYLKRFFPIPIVGYQKNVVALREENGEFVSNIYKVDGGERRNFDFLFFVIIFASLIFLNSEFSALPLLSVLLFVSARTLAMGGIFILPALLPLAVLLVIGAGLFTKRITSFSFDKIVPELIFLLVFLFLSISLFQIWTIPSVIPLYKWKLSLFCGVVLIISAWKTVRILLPQLKEMGRRFRRQV